MWTRIYRKLETCFPDFDVDRWWGIADPFARMAGSVLVQNTSWQQASSALSALEAHGWLTPDALAARTPDELIPVIRTAGFPRAKSETLIRLARWVEERGGVDRLRRSDEPVDRLRRELMGIKGIGPETADTILAYALGRATISGDAYTRRLAERLTGQRRRYEELRTDVMAELTDARSLARLHGLVVEHGKHICRKRDPQCRGCPFSGECVHERQTEPTIDA